VHNLVEIVLILENLIRSLPGSFSDSGCVIKNDFPSGIIGWSGPRKLSRFE
jgi:hypothetical protein